MTMIRTTLICTSANRDLANSLAEPIAECPDLFICPLTTNTDTTVGPTHWACSGDNDTAMVADLVANAGVESIPLTGAITFNQQIAAHTPVLRRYTGE